MPAPKPANDNRPAGYDAQLVAYRPFLVGLVSRKGYHINGSQEDFISEVHLRALHYADRYKPEYKFSTWLGLMARNIWNENKRKDRMIKRRGAVVEIDADDDFDWLSTEPNQEHSADLAAVLAVMPAGRNGDILMRVAAGAEMKELAAEYGVSVQRISEICKTGRAAIKKALQPANDNIDRDVA